MKRSLGGGALRGPLGLRRQRRTIRFVQILLVLIGAGFTAFAVIASAGVGRQPDPSTLARPATVGQPIVLGVMALAAWGAAWLLGDGRGVRIPTPARLDELAGRAERAALERVETTGGDEERDS